MIHFLPDTVLLEIFDIYRMDEVATSSSDLPWKWHKLVHVCRTWRDIIFSSSCRLNLELLCTHGTPFRKILDHLPALPIVIHMRSDAVHFITNSVNDDDIIAALEHPNRIHIIKLTAACSLLGKVVATMTQVPFPVLTDLWLELKQKNTDGPMPVLPDAFLGGYAPRLQRIYLEGIPFPAAATLFLSARDLVAIVLLDIPDTGYISPEAMARSLAALPRLKYLALGFRRGTSHPDRIRQPPIIRTVLPFTTFVFHGLFDYLEDFVAQIDTPQLNCFDIECFDHGLDEGVDIEFSQLCKFIERFENFRRPDVVTPYEELDGDIVDVEFDEDMFRLSIMIPDEWIGLMDE